MLEQGVFSGAYFIARRLNTLCTFFVIGLHMAYLESSQASKVEIFMKIVNGLQPSLFLQKGPS